MYQANSPVELIDMAATQAIEEGAHNNGGVEVVKKVNLNFGNMKLNENKKRFRTANFPVNEVQMKNELS